MTPFFVFLFFTIVEKLMQWPRNNVASNVVGNLATQINCLVMNNNAAYFLIGRFTDNCHVVDSYQEYGRIKIAALYLPQPKERK